MSRSDATVRLSQGDLRNMGVFEHIDGDGYEQIVYCSDDSSGLKAIIAIHFPV